MPTKAELEKQNATLRGQVTRLKNKQVAGTEDSSVPEGMEEFLIGGHVVTAPKGAQLRSSSSHPVEGLTEAVFSIKMAAGDGRVDADATRYVWRK